MNKMYLVTADLSGDPWGIDIVAFGLFDSLEKAKEIASKVEGQYKNSNIQEIPVNTPIELGIACYIE